MFSSRKWMGSAVLCGLALAFAFLPEYAASRSPESKNMLQSGANEAVPAYHDHVPPGTLPATMNPEFFTDPGVQNAYTIAARIKKTLYQQPCYCHCDRSQGHGSLLDCFAKPGAGYLHGKDCLRTIARETAAQIRVIIRATGNRGPRWYRNHCPQSESGARRFATKRALEPSCHNAGQFVN
jgi:hypothetical protein